MPHRYFTRELAEGRAALTGSDDYTGMTQAQRTDAAVKRARPPM